MKLLFLMHLPNFFFTTIISVRIYYSYCIKALKGTNFTIDEKIFDSEDVNVCLKKWKHVLLFYTVRLMFAPLIENVILFDRYLYLKEGKKNNFRSTYPFLTFNVSGGQSNLEVLFNPMLSPRNHLLCGTKY